MPWPWWAGGLLGWAACKNEQTYLSWAVFRVVRVVRVPWPNTRITRNNFGYRGLEPELRFGFFEFGFFGFGLGFFGFGFRVSGILPTHRFTLHLNSQIVGGYLELFSGRFGYLGPV